MDAKRDIEVKISETDLTLELQAKIVAGGTGGSGGAIDDLVISGLNGRITDVDTRVTTVDSKVEGLATQATGIIASVMGIGTSVTDLDTKVTDLNTTITGVDGLATQISEVTTTATGANTKADAVTVTVGLVDDKVNGFGLQLTNLDTKVNGIGDFTNAVNTKANGIGTALEVLTGVVETKRSKGDILESELAPEVKTKLNNGGWTLTDKNTMTGIVGTIEMWTGTQMEYDLLVTKADNVLYIVR